MTKARYGVWSDTGYYVADCETTLKDALDIASAYVYGMGGLAEVRKTAGHLYETVCVVCDRYSVEEAPKGLKTFVVRTYDDDVEDGLEN